MGIGKRELSDFLRKTKTGWWKNIEWMKRHKVTYEDIRRHNKTNSEEAEDGK